MNLIEVENNINEIKSSLMNYISSKVFSVEDRQDILQDALLLIFKNKNKFNPNKGSFKSFAISICYFQIKGYLTKHKRNKEFSVLDTSYISVDKESLNTANNFRQAELRELNKLKNKIINNIYSTLPPQWKLIAILHFKKGCSYIDITKITNKSYGYIGPTMMRIKKHLIAEGQKYRDIEYGNTHL